MNTQKKSAYCALTLSALVILTTAHQTQADLLISVNKAGTGLPIVERYSNTGVDLGFFSAPGDESYDRLFYNANRVYEIGNTLGTLTLYDLNATTTAQLASRSPASLLTNGWDGTILATTTKSTTSLSILELNPNTLATIKTAITIPTPTSGFGGFAFGPDNKLYIAEQNSLVTYSRAPDGTISEDTSFDLSPSSHYLNIAFSPTDPNNIYVHAFEELPDHSLQFHIDRYNITTGDFVDTFISSSTFDSFNHPVSAGAGPFTIGDDGTFYFLNSTNLVAINPNTGLISSQSSLPIGTQIGAGSGFTFVPSITPEPATLLTLAFTACPLLLRRKNRS